MNTSIRNYLIILTDHGMIRSIMIADFSYRKIHHDSMLPFSLSQPKKQRAWTQHNVCCSKSHMKRLRTVR